MANDERSDRFSLRPATRADIPAIMAIEAECPTAGHWPANEYSRIFESGRESGSTPRTILVIESGNHVAGFLVARCIFPEWELENIAVERSSQRQGLARMLLKDLLQRALSQSAARIFLEVRESNQPARSLYSQLGFQETGRRPAYYSHPIEDAITYEIVIEI